MHISKGLKQSYQLQDFTFEAAMALRDSLTKDGKLVISREDAQAVKALVSSWRDCQERVSFHRRTPAPGVLKPEREPKRRRNGWSGGKVVPLTCEAAAPEPPTCSGSAG